MQFIAPDPERVRIRQEKPPVYSVGGDLMREKVPAIYAQFRRGLPGWAVPTAIDLYTTDRIPSSDVTPGQWFGFFDSIEAQAQNDWTDEERELVERELVAKGYDLVEREKATPPYPAYSRHRKVQGKRTVEHAIKDIVAAIEQTGINFDSVFHYEQDFADANTEAVLNGVKAALAGGEKEELVAA